MLDISAIWIELLSVCSGSTNPGILRVCEGALYLLRRSDCQPHGVQCEEVPGQGSQAKHQRDTGVPKAETRRL